MIQVTSKPSNFGAEALKSQPVRPTRFSFFSTAKKVFLGATVGYVAAQLAYNHFVSPSRKDYLPNALSDHDTQASKPLFERFFTTSPHFHGTAIGRAQQVVLSFLECPSNMILSTFGLPTSQPPGNLQAYILSGDSQARDLVFDPKTVTQEMKNNLLLQVAERVNQKKLVLLEQLGWLLDQGADPNVFKVLRSRGGDVLVHPIQSALLNYKPELLGKMLKGGLDLEKFIMLSPDDQFSVVELALDLIRFEGEGLPEKAKALVQAHQIYWEKFYVEEHCDLLVNLTTQLYQHLIKNQSLYHHIEPKELQKLFYQAAVSEACHKEFEPYIVTHQKQEDEGSKAKQQTFFDRVKILYKIGAHVFTEFFRGFTLEPDPDTEKCNKRVLQLLSLGESDTKRSIRKACRLKLAERHPDRVGDSKLAEFYALEKCCTYLKSDEGYNALRGGRL